MRDVKYFAPNEIDDALKLLAKYGEKITVLAGGTDLVPKINYHDLKPDALLYVGKLCLDYIEEKDGKLFIGATTPTNKVAASTLIIEKVSALAEAARQSGCVATRTCATIGGNLANASPAADLATPLLVMEADLILESVRGKRVVPIMDFFKGPGKTVLKADELIVEISIPSLKGKSTFVKLGRRKAMTLSVVNFALWLDIANDFTGQSKLPKFKMCKDVRIALGSMAPTPLRCIKAECLIKGKILDKALITQCAAEAIVESNPIDDGRATAWYRKKAGEATITRALAQISGIEI